jgi:hypothetical protein
LGEPLFFVLPADLFSIIVTASRLKMERVGEKRPSIVGQVDSPCAVSQSTGELDALGGLAPWGRFFLDLAFWQTSQHPQVMSQHTPSDGELAMSKAFAADRRA